MSDQENVYPDPFYTVLEGASIGRGSSGGPVWINGSNGEPDILGRGSQPDASIAGTGSETLVGSAGGGRDTMFANTGSDAMFAGNGNDTFIACSGSAQIIGGPCQDLFVFVNGAAGGSDSIWNFTPGQDHVALFGYGTGIAPSLLAAAVITSSATTSTLPDQTTITFGNVSQLAASYFLAS